MFSINMESTNFSKFNLIDGKIVRLTDSQSQPYTFTTQKDYEECSQYCLTSIQFELKRSFQMKEYYVPAAKPYKTFKKLESKAFKPQVPIFATTDFSYNPKLLVIIQGTGQVQAGMWSRSACINGSLDEGSMLPYVQIAIKEGYAVLIMNPNVRTDASTGLPVDEFNSMEKHALHVWKEVVMLYSPAKEIDIVAHSMGGYCTIRIIQQFGFDNIRKIAFTDSVHGSSFTCLKLEEKKKLRQHAINFVTSKKKAGSFEREGFDGCVNLSCGNEKHEYSSGYAIKEVFAFFKNEKYLQSKLK